MTRMPERMGFHTRLGRTVSACGFLLAALLATCVDARPAEASAAPSDGTYPFDAPACGANDNPLSGSAPSRPAEPPIADMSGASEAVPHGAVQENGEPMSWALKPRMGLGNEPPPGWSYMVPWGQVYATVEDGGSGGNASNTRVEVRNLRLFVRDRSTKRWCRAADTAAPEGGFFREDFATDESIKGDQRPGPDGGTSIGHIAGRCFHFFTDKRYLIPEGGVDAIYSDFEARLILADPKGPDDRDKATFVASAGTDYWSSLTSATGYFGIHNQDAGMGRFKRITPSWRIYSMNTAVPE